MHAKRPIQIEFIAGGSCSQAWVCMPIVMARVPVERGHHQRQLVAISGFLLQASCRRAVLLLLRALPQCFLGVHLLHMSQQSEAIQAVNRFVAVHADRAKNEVKAATALAELWAAMAQAKVKASLGTANSPMHEPRRR